MEKAEELKSMSTEEKLDKAFHALRQRGFITKHSFCCVQRGFQEIEKIIEDRIDKGEDSEKILGGVFHIWDSLYEEDEDIDSFYLFYDSIHVDGYGRIGLPDEEIVKIVCEELKKVNIKYKCGDDPGSAIEIFPDEMKTDISVDFGKGVDMDESN